MYICGTVELYEIKYVYTKSILHKETSPFKSMYLQNFYNCYYGKTATEFTMQKTDTCKLVSRINRYYKKFDYFANFLYRQVKIKEKLKLPFSIKLSLTLMGFKILKILHLYQTREPLKRQSRVQQTTFINIFSLFYRENKT